MSLLKEHRGNLFNKIPSILNQYNEFLSEAKNDLELSGKTLGDASKEHPSLQMYYHERLVELNTLLKYCEMELNKVKSLLYVDLVKNSKMALSDREREKFIMGEDKFITMNKVWLEVKELHDKFDAVYGAFISRGYSLNNITKARVASIEDAIL